MDMNPITPFQKELAALERALAKAKTSNVERLERKLSDERTKRAEAQGAFEALCGKERTKTPMPGNVPTRDMIDLQDDLKASDARIGSLKHDLAKARAEMLPSVMDAALSSFAPVLVALDEALRIVEGAREVHGVYDRWASHNGFGSALRPRSIKLNEIAKRLADFLKDETR